LTVKKPSEIDLQEPVGKPKNGVLSVKKEESVDHSDHSDDRHEEDTDDEDDEVSMQDILRSQSHVDFYHFINMQFCISYVVLYINVYLFQFIKNWLCILYSISKHYRVFL